MPVFENNSRKGYDATYKAQKRQERAVKAKEGYLTDFTHCPITGLPVSDRATSNSFIQPIKLRNDVHKRF